MPLLYERTDQLARYYGNKIVKLSPSPDLTMFLAGVFTGFFILPIVMTFIGYKVEKMRT